MRPMLDHRARFDHGFHPQNAVGAAWSHVSKIIARLRAPNSHRLNRYGVALNPALAAAMPGLSRARVHAPIPIAALKSP